MINYIFGEIKKIKTIKKNIFRKFSQCEDQAISLFYTKKNIPGILVQDMVSENKERYIEVFLNDSTIKLDIVKNQIYIFRKKKKYIIKNKYKSLQLELMKKNIIEFLSIINKNKFSIKPFDEAVFDLKICNKMHEKF